MGFALVFVQGGCKSKNALPEASGAASSAGPGEMAAPDELGRGELLIGKEDAFGLPLPEGMKISRKSSDSVRAQGSLSPEVFTEFVRSRVEAEVETEPRRTRFSRAKVKAPVGGVVAGLRIDITVVEGVTIADITIDPRGPVGLPPGPPRAPPAGSDDP